MKISIKPEDWQEKISLQTEVTGDPDWIGHSGASFVKPVQVEAELVRLADGIELNGTLRITISEVCAWCLEDFTAAYCWPLQRSWRYTAEPDSQEADLLLKNQEELSLTPLLAETILLELPLIPKCREDCRGICAQCGENLNISNCLCRSEALDPRWEKLNEWKNP